MTSDDTKLYDPHQYARLGTVITSDMLEKVVQWSKHSKQFKKTDRVTGTKDLFIALDGLEAILRMASTPWIRRGAILGFIKENELYKLRGKHGFDSYLKKVLDIHRLSAEKLIRAAVVVLQFSPETPLPESHNIACELYKLAVHERESTWLEILEIDKQPDPMLVNSVVKAKIASSVDIDLFDISENNQQLRSAAPSAVFAVGRQFDPRDLFALIDGIPIPDKTCPLCAGRGVADHDTGMPIHLRTREFDAAWGAYLLLRKECQRPLKRSTFLRVSHYFSQIGVDEAIRVLDECIFSNSVIINFDYGRIRAARETLAQLDVDSDSHP